LGHVAVEMRAARVLKGAKGKAKVRAHLDSVASEPVDGLRRGLRAPSLAPSYADSALSEATARSRMIELVLGVARPSSVAASIE
jgi:hypothetical protein